MHKGLILEPQVRMKELGNWQLVKDIVALNGIPQQVMSGDLTIKLVFTFSCDSKSKQSLLYYLP